MLIEGMSGPQVEALQKRLKELGFNPGAIDGDFGPATEAAVIAFQKSEDLVADGVVGSKTFAKLKIDADAVEAALVAASTGTGDSITGSVTVTKVSKMFPSTPVGNISKNLPFILKALDAVKLGDKDMVLVALATIRAETEGFVPIDEFRSKFNTSPHGHPFDLYDNRSDLGNNGKPDGASFKGRGFVQLTGRSNYTKFGPLVGEQNLVNDPKRANDPTVAAKLLAHFLKSKEAATRTALKNGDLKKARKLVNGGSHGLDRFTDAFNRGKLVL